MDALPDGQEEGEAKDSSSGAFNTPPQYDDGEDLKAQPISGFKNAQDDIDEKMGDESSEQFIYKNKSVDNGEPDENVDVEDIQVEVEEVQESPVTEEVKPTRGGRRSAKKSDQKKEVEAPKSKKASARKTPAKAARGKASTAKGRASRKKKGQVEEEEE